MLREEMDRAMGALTAQLVALIEQQLRARFEVPEIWTRGIPANTNGSPWFDSLGTTLPQTPYAAVMLTILLFAGRV